MRIKCADVSSTDFRRGVYVGSVLVLVLDWCFRQLRMFDLATISRLESGNKWREFMYETGLTAQHVASTIILEKCSNAGVGKHSRDVKSDYQTSKRGTSEESYARFMVNPR